MEAIDVVNYKELRLRVGPLIKHVWVYDNQKLQSHACIWSMIVWYKNIIFWCYLGYGPAFRNVLTKWTIAHAFDPIEESNTACQNSTLIGFDQISHCIFSLEKESQNVVISGKQWSSENMLMQNYVSSYRQLGQERLRTEKLITLVTMWYYACSRSWAPCIFLFHLGNQRYSFGKYSFSLQNSLSGKAYTKKVKHIIGQTF